MANVLYDLGRQHFLAGDLDWDAQTFKAALVSNGYTPNTATHEFWSSVNSFVVGTPQTLANKTNTNGIADADDVTFATVTAGSTVNYIVIYRDTGVAGTSQLVAFVDTATGLPLSTNGGDITVQWDNTASVKIFKL